jgi:hypothetical protein
MKEFCIAKRRPLKKTVKCTLQTTQGQRLFRDLPLEIRGRKEFMQSVFLAKLFVWPIITLSFSHVSLER